MKYKTFIVCLSLLWSSCHASDCSSCKQQGGRKVMGIFSKPSLPVGYNMITRVPPGSCNVTIKESGPSSNFLALKTKNGYIINGNWAVLPDGRYMGGGTGFTYTHSDNGETISSKGPTVEFVDIMIIYHAYNPGVTYEYWHPVYFQHTPSVSFLAPPASHTVQIPGSITTSLNSPRRKRPGLNRRRFRKPTRRRTNRFRNRRKFLQNGNKPSFINSSTDTKNENKSPIWTVWKFTPCSRSCGRGQQKTTYICTDFNGQVLDDEFCLQPKPTPQTIECNSQPCSPIWVLDDWSPCSVTCGTGQRVRKWSCVQEVTPTLTRTLLNSMCPAFNQENRVPLTQLCTMAPCTRWEVTPWSKCSLECGTGFRTRDVICQADGIVLTNDQCNSQERPPTTELCHGLYCSTNTWFFTDWSDECVGGCENGVHVRQVWCAPSVNSIEGRCSALNRPADQKPCNDILTCVAAWFTGPWSACSSECGNGTRSREVVCVVHIKGTFRATLDIECDNRRRPPEIEECNTENCPPRWYYTEWSQCSKACGRGSEKRAVQCLDSFQKPSLDCLIEQKPNTIRPCNTHPCSGIRDENCLDQYSHCDFVVRARLCQYSYYKKICCASCL